MYSSLRFSLKTPALLVLFLLLELPLVKLKFVALKNIAICTPRLPRTGRNACQKAPTLELLINYGIHFLLRLSVLLLANDMTAALLFVLGRFLGLAFIFLDAKRDAH